MRDQIGQSLALHRTLRQISFEIQLRNTPIWTAWNWDPMPEGVYPTHNNLAQGNKKGETGGRIEEKKIINNIKITIFFMYVII